MRAWHGRRSFVLTRPHRSQAGIVLALFEQPPSTLVVTRHTLPLPPPHIISHTHTQCTPSCRCTPCSRLASCPHFWCACARTWCEQLTGQAKRRLAEAPSLARTSGPSAVRQPQQPCLAQSHTQCTPSCRDEVALALLLQNVALEVAPKERARSASGGGEGGRGRALYVD